MVTGTLFPAFASLLILKAITKQPIGQMEARSILIFAGASIIGGYFTAKIIENNDKNLS